MAYLPENQQSATVRMGVPGAGWEPVRSFDVGPGDSFDDYVTEAHLRIVRESGSSVEEYPYDLKLLTMAAYLMSQALSATTQEEVDAAAAFFAQAMGPGASADKAHVICEHAGAWYVEPQRLG